MVMMNHKQKRDDVASRLFFLLKEVYGFDVKKINMLKHNVWMVAAREGCWVVKKYRTFFEAMKQAMLMQSLRQMGFRHVPAVYTAIGQHGVFFFAGRFWITQTYISGAKMLSFTEKKGYCGRAAVVANISFRYGHASFPPDMANDAPILPFI
jgi:hypothetical protein